MKNGRDNLGVDVPKVYFCCLKIGEGDGRR